MLPDYPELKKDFQEMITEYIQEMAKKEPLLQNIRQEIHHEGNRMETHSMDRYVDKTDYKKMDSGFSVKKDELLKGGAFAVIKNVTSMIEDIKKQQAKAIFDKINEVTEKTGNVTDHKGKPFSFDTFLDGLRKIQIDFDDNGKPYMPSMFVGPQLAERIRKLLPEWEKNPDYSRRHEEIMKQKRKEFDERESHRKLVD